MIVALVLELLEEHVWAVEFFPSLVELLELLGFWIVGNVQGKDLHD